jgi:hypothetical protein
MLWDGNLVSLCQYPQAEASDNPKQMSENNHEPIGVIPQPWCTKKLISHLSKGFLRKFIRNLLLNADFTTIRHSDDNEHR